MRQINNILGCTAQIFKTTMYFHILSPSKDSDIPMVLVQGIDIYNIYHTRNDDCWSPCAGQASTNCKCELGISKTNKTIPSELMQVKIYEKLFRFLK